MSNIRKIKTILSSSRLFEQSSSRNLSAGKLDSTYYNFMTASYLSNEHLQDSMTFAMTAPLIFQINELKEDVDDLHTHLSESLYTNRETSFGGSILVSSHITASGNISSSGTGDNYFGGNLNIVNDSGTELNFTGTGNTNITTAGNMYIKAGSSKKVYLGANNTDSQITIDTSGWLGIGDTSPNAPLDIESSENILARFTSTDDDAKIIIEDDDTIGYHNVRNNYHSFGFDGYTTRSPLFVVSGSLTNGVWGKVGIGTSTPVEVLTVMGNISSSGNIIADFPDTNDNALHYPLVTDGNTIEKLNDLNFNPSTGLVQVGGSLQINSTNIVLGTTGTISTTSHITAGGYISSSGAINTLSHITASGNISASGVIYGKQIQHTYHQYNTDSLNTGQYIPAPGGYVIEGTSINYYRQWIAPFNGRLRKLMIYCENDPGNARISLYADGSFVKRKTESFGAATSTNFDFDNPDGGGDSVFSAGQRIAILIDPLNIPGDVNVVCTWEYDINL